MTHITESTCPRHTGTGGHVNGPAHTTLDDSTPGAGRFAFGVLDSADLHSAGEYIPTGRPHGRRRGRRFGDGVWSLAGGFDPWQVGWRLGTCDLPRGGGPLWVPYDRTAGVIGPQGSGKTLDLLTPALLGAPGAALVTLTKPGDLLLTIAARTYGGRPAVVLDPFGLAPGLPELVWDPIDGCADPMLAERRAKAFTAGTVKGAVTGGTGDDAARFYAGEAAKVLQGYFHAAALAGHTLDTVLDWIADPRATTVPEEILRTDPRAAEHWDGLLRGALRGDERTSANTITTVQQALNLYFQPSIRARCVPSALRPTTNLREVIAANGTIYMLGREDPYASASPLMTAVAEDILDTALALAYESEHLRVTPAFIAILDELPSTTPLPTLATRMANERANGLCFIWASQTERQMTMVYGKDQAAAIRGLTNVLVIFGGSKDVDFTKDISALLDTERVLRRSRSRQGLFSTSTSVTDSYEDVPVLRPGQIRKIATGHALVIAENASPIIARLDRCITSRTGHVLLHQQKTLTRLVDQARTLQTAPSTTPPRPRDTTSPGATASAPAATPPTPKRRETRPVTPELTADPAPQGWPDLGTDQDWAPISTPTIPIGAPPLYVVPPPTDPGLDATQAISVGFLDQYRDRP